MSGNYASKVERKLRNLPDTRPEHGFSFHYSAERIRMSEHFILPAGGHIFDDKLKGINKTNVRLPFRSITAEFTFDRGAAAVVSAWEMNREDAAPVVREFMDKTGSTYCFVVSAFFIIDGSLVPMLGFSLLPSFVSIDNDGSYDVYVIVDPAANNVESHSDGLIKASDSIYELIEALSCSNVTTEIATKAKCRRNASGKKILPVYETKRLVINAGSEKRASKSAGHDQDRNRPREHLRRGHIRRLSNGNVWVNSCVVGSRSNGVINKTYEVAA